MARMIDLVRSSAVPATLMQAAARGALSVPSAEMIEILVYLANHNKVFGQQARMTLAGWEEKSSVEAASDPNTPAEVLEYLIAPENLRPRLLPALLDNPAIADSKLAEMAEKGSREIVDAMRQSVRVQKSPAILRALALNPNSTEREAQEEQERADLASSLDGAVQEQGDGTSAEPSGTPEEEAAIAAFIAEHSKELALEGEKPFQPLGGLYELELSAVHEEAPAAVTAETPIEPQPATPVIAAATATAPAAAAAVRKAHVAPKKAKSAEEERGSALQKISKLDVKGRIQLAMKGNKEERSILIRDGTKLVALAVLENGKISDGEVEKFASQKNVLEAVLRQIPMKRRFAKNYNVVRNLVANPRTPLDLSLGLMKNIMAPDLKNLASNKEVSETIRKLALKMFKAKTDPNKKSH
ncbi:MAG TPA: hypothetical protein VK466_09000 [Terriglobales bacterium]|nr:hypothetical protein [Terriglobales bacterium]